MTLGSDHQCTGGRFRLSLAVQKIKIGATSVGQSWIREPEPLKGEAQRQRGAAMTQPCIAPQWRVTLEADHGRSAYVYDIRAWTEAEACAEGQRCYDVERPSGKARVTGAVPV